MKIGLIAVMRPNNLSILDLLGLDNRETIKYNNRYQYKRSVNSTCYGIKNQMSDLPCPVAEI